MLFDTAVAVLGWFGVVVFAVSGALVASRKQMDIVGFALLGVVAGIGGGTLRDVLLGELPVSGCVNPLTSWIVGRKRRCSRARHIPISGRYR